VAMLFTAMLSRGLCYLKIGLGDCVDEEIGRLITQLRQLEDQIECKFEQRRKAFEYRLENRKIIFTESVLAQQRRLRIGLIIYLRSSSLTQIICIPFVYGLFIPLLLLDISVSLYQRVCFTFWALPKTIRSDYVVFDRRHLAYLNGIQKLNCLFCSYANGVIAFAQEIASQTEQYWCPIKHAARMRVAHKRYQNFLEYGDAEGFQRKSDEYRRQLQNPTVAQEQNM